jgi:hypothetical protein
MATATAFAQSDNRPDIGVPVHEGMRAPAARAAPFHIKPSVTNTAPTDDAGTVRRAYGFDQIANGGEVGRPLRSSMPTIIPNIESDLGVFSTTFRLPPGTTANGRFQKIYASGPKPRTDAG